MNPTRDPLPPLNGIPACEHPSFPLKRRERTHRGKPYAEWVRKIKKQRVSFGACVNDPTGELAWRLYELERASWEAKRNPRAGLRRLSFARAFGRWNPSWLLAGPLAKAGVGIIDPRHGRLMCLNCFATWTVRFKKAEDIPKGQLKCPRDCTSLPLSEAKQAIELARREPGDLVVEMYERLVKAKRDGWHSAPQDVDGDAEAEGRAIELFVRQFRLRQPRNGRGRSLHRNDVIRRLVAIAERAGLP